MNLTIIGTGYVGLVTGACFAELGNKVTCLDINPQIINKLKQSKVSFFEPGLEELVKDNLDKKNLSFTTSYKRGCQNNIFFICVDTPDNGKGSPNLNSLDSVVKRLKKEIRRDAIIVLKSTLPIGTNKLIAQSLNKHFQPKGINIDVCSNPEFLKEGSAVKDFFYPDRIILGATNNYSKSILSKLYKPLKRKSNKFLFMSVESAELTKYASNAFLATKISFINEIALIAEKSNANIREVQKGMGSDKRIGSEFLNAGLGFGGSCFPKDMKALISYEKKHNIYNGIIENALSVNENQIHLFAKKIKSFFGSSLKRQTFILWGLSFKPNTDDTRDAVAMQLIKLLSSKVKALHLFDPKVKRESVTSLKKYSNVKFLNSQYENFEKANALIICTEWEDFFNPKIEHLLKLKDKVVFDGRNILDEQKLAKNDIDYFGIGLKYFE
ncbi:UDP-glucose/GDP-mannose dehydrogenase family protein [Gammaproteobacteria bacterium]|nr:UDP-glucose/GDP-mannose dehydrogenase family protein [Gammaproteobacteria bacterium]